VQNQQGEQTAALLTANLQWSSRRSDLESTEYPEIHRPAPS
jgi:hypothetical protein